MKVECYAATLAQEGRKFNEDAWLILRGDPLCAALCDGAGDAQRAAKRTLQTFEKFFKSAQPDEISSFQTWSRWVKLLDSALMGGMQSTFVAIAVLDGRIVGTCVGDSRLYKITRSGEITIPSEGASKFRLGSGKANPFPIHLPVNIVRIPGTVYLIDGLIKADIYKGEWAPRSFPLILFRSGDGRIPGTVYKIHL